MSLVDLKPCPFCGGYATLERMGGHAWSCIVTCVECGCTLESNEQWPNSGKKWNQRVTPIADFSPSGSNEGGHAS
ncbi:hypothetical protein RPMA_12635 [Tardiphaga alba]|uniref:Restriction alleviation protein, Lar family n=1 Tax=Tardiphaga alba TaxID=340268 RepID=A0ABX8ACQ0_9BRAD|nr:hypothetical protein RPMA_12635 [Tardiphaga alba]